MLSVIFPVHQHLKLFWGMSLLGVWVLRWCNNLLASFLHANLHERKAPQACSTAIQQALRRAAFSCFVVRCIQPNRSVSQLRQPSFSPSYIPKWLFLFPVINCLTRVRVSHLFIEVISHCVSLCLFIFALNPCDLAFSLYHCWPGRSLSAFFTATLGRFNLSPEWFWK